METIIKTAFKAFLVMLVVVGSTSMGLAQYANEATIRDTVSRIQTRTDNLQRALQNASDRGNYRADDADRLILDFESAVNQLDRRLQSRRASAADVRVVLDRAALIDNFFAANRIGAGSQREWQSLRVDLDQLARYYNLSATWGSGSSGGYNDYNLNDAQMRQLIQRIDTRSVAFSRNLRQDLNRSYGSNRNSADEARRQLSAFESALVQLRNRVNTRQATTSDVRNLLDRAAYLNTYVNDRQLSYQTENTWSNLRQDLERLASAFNLAWNWTETPGSDSGTRADLTGTFRYNPSQGDDARRAVDAATRNLSLSERQRVYDALLRRLDPPQMLAIDRRGNQVTIASTRAPQINFVADGREKVETTPGGRTVRVRADLAGDTLTITRSGERANDFTVTFDPTDNGRQLLVTRTLYTERVNQPVTVRTYYDRISDVAQLNVYDTNREDTNVGGAGAVGSFVIPNGTEVVGVLNNDLSTQNVREGERFTMTVRSPGQYEGATIEGHVTSVSRGGRITGRSEMTLDFDSIRLRDGRSYSFAGILESVRTPAGEVVRVDNEGAVRESDQTKTTVTRTAIGTAVGAIIGAIAGGGKGAAIGAVIGAGAGAGSVYVQGRNDLVLEPGTEVTVRATGPQN
ncbi:MAG TPA: YMGG-like glycine zipper-containing protein [Pyrinomonadaceae bacterium]|nr:YMGG-like glycine zipper-containing protein [Pyrinomonadaceae bacterium]